MTLIEREYQMIEVSKDERTFQYEEVVFLRFKKLVKLDDTRVINPAHNLDLCQEYVSSFTHAYAFAQQIKSSPLRIFARCTSGKSKY